MDIQYRYPQKAYDIIDNCRDRGTLLNPQSRSCILSNIGAAARNSRLTEDTLLYQIKLSKY